MSKPKSLTRRQRAVIEELFADGANEQRVLEKHGISRDLYSRWLTEERFCEAFEKRIAQAHHTARILLARHAPRAAQTLIDLTKCSKEETARKACLDIVVAPIASATDETPRTAPKPDPITELPPETATRLLAALAESRTAPV